MRTPSPRIEEIVAVTVPVLIEAVAVVMFIGMIAIWAAIGSGA
jgi:hypothetical protein